MNITSDKRIDKVVNPNGPRSFRLDAMILVAQKNGKTFQPFENLTYYIF